MRLSALVENTNNIYDKKILTMQRTLALSLNFRLLAVYNITSKVGSETPGIDRISLKTPEQKLEMVETLASILKNPHEYKSLPVKRIPIPKANSKKMCYIGIPTLTDRCLQSLINLVLEPVVETTSDKHSYGFRKFRSAKMAIGAVRRNLRSAPNSYDKFVLDVDILSFFDNISQK
jgi:RNA-directed DNA polymerase